MSRPFVIFAILLGCSSSGTEAVQQDAGGEGGGGDDVAAACASFASAYCARFDGCSDFFVQFAFGDVETCKQRVSLGCRGWGDAPGTSGGRAAIDACAANAATTTCADLFAGKTCTMPPGTLADGSPCGSGGQCKSGFCPVGDDGCGKCTPPPPEGAACISRQCGMPQRCVQTGICVTPKLQSQPCSVSDECAIPMSCVDGQCTNPAPLDAACSTAGMSMAPDCDFTKGEVCAMSTCIKAGLANTGETCGYEVGKVTLCRASGQCQSGSMPTGTCRPVAGDGEPCDSVMGPRCMGPALCLRGVCRIPDPASCR